MKDTKETIQLKLSIARVGAIKDIRKQSVFHRFKSTSTNKKRGSIETNQHMKANRKKMHKL